jgi:NAD(P)-dependent dehydrogenase (short-subunit alcohol dehydrogenase family)
MKPIHEIFSLKDKIAVVTGGAVNIGKAISQRLAEAGAKVVVIFNHSLEKAILLQDEFYQKKVEALFIQCDISNEKAVIGAFARIHEHFGGVDVLVNNAGIFGLSMQEDLDEAGWDAVFDLNSKGLFFCSREAIKLMKSTGQGNIVNIASINGLHPGFGKTAHYDATKGAVIAYTKSLAAEVAAYKIRVNAVAPGLVDSEGLRNFAPDLAEVVEKRTPLGKIAKHEDIANTVLFLACEASSHITGETVVVDGGYLLT